ncbi:MAG: hypothetical protein V4662_12790 [Verrucomicrobiota bacterium]
MSLSDAQSHAITEFPEVLQRLIHAELAAGNSILEIGAGFPAPPVGACLKLEKKVSTRARESDNDIDFRARNSSLHSGEFTDGKRFFFVLEPPDEPAAYPDMDAIRAEREARQRAADEELCALRDREVRQAIEAARARPDEDVSPKIAIRHPTPLVSRFLESMEMNFDRWHDGTGYDLTVFESATPNERKQLEKLLITRPLADWRDVEALAALDSAPARAYLRRVFERTGLSQKIDIISYATSLFTDDERAEVLVKALQEAGQGQAMIHVMLEIQAFHPPCIMEALLEGVKAREDVIAGEFAMMLLFLHGKAESPYDDKWRPFMLRFQGEAREPLCQELCRHLGLADK